MQRNSRGSGQKRSRSDKISLGKARRSPRNSGKAHTPGESRNWLGSHIRALRVGKKLTLREMVERTGFSVSGLSKIENGRLAVTFDKMVTIADALDIELSHLLSRTDDSAPNGRRSVTRKGKGEVYRTGQYDYEMLCADLAKKRIIPLVTKIELRSLEEFGPLVRHDGEEFVYVLKGRIELHTEFYEPVTLNPGDGAYFDSNMGHAMTCRSGNGRVLWISTRPGRDGLGPSQRAQAAVSHKSAASPRAAGAPRDRRMAPKTTP